MLTDHEARALEADVMAGGWASLDIERTQKLRAHHAAKMRIEQREKARVVRDALATPAGQRFLAEFLKPRTIEFRQTPAEAGATTAEAYAIAAARREGRNSIWWAIQDALAFDEAPSAGPKPSVEEPA